MKRTMKVLFITLVVVQLHSLLAWAQETLDLQPNRKQLFIDDYVVSKISNLQRKLHQPIKYPENPILRPQHPWENLIVQTRNAPFWDPVENVWKLFYMAFALYKSQNVHTSCYAISRDGIQWEKPALNLVEWQGSKKNNLLTRYESEDSFLYHVLYDPRDVPARRYKGLFGVLNRQPAVSPDGYRWTLLSVPSIPSQDESQLNYDELSNQFIATVKHEGPYGRSVYLAVSKDFDQWTKPEMIFHADGRDQELGRDRIAQRLTDPRFFPLTINKPDAYNTDIYNMPVFSYEGLYLGMPMKFNQSGPTPIGNQDGFHHIELVSSRDLRRWSRVADRAIFIPNSYAGPGVYDTGSIVPPTRAILRDHELWFYYSGIKWRFHPDNVKTLSNGTKTHVSIPDSGAVLLAKLRLDGFVSLDADELEGSLVTRPMTVHGKRLYVNVDAPGGEVRAEILDQQSKSLITPFSKDNCIPVRGNQLKVELRWQGESDLSKLEKQTIRLRFSLKKASLYAFWVEE
jgi:hypothetical protein